MINEDLKTRVLAFLENHRKSMIKTILTSFPHENKVAVLRCVIVLWRAGWVKVNREFTLDGYRIKQRIAYRTDKQMYSQLSLTSLIDSL